MSSKKRGEEGEGKRKVPTARTCPLVLDGEIEASEFSPSDCFSCPEFDCPFCLAEAGSGSLGSRPFEGEATAEGEDDEWGDASFQDQDFDAYGAEDDDGF